MQQSFKGVRSTHARQATRINAAPTSQSRFASRAGSQYFGRDSRPIILYDGVCQLCNGGVNTALNFDKDGKLRFAALQSNAGKQLLQRSGRSPDDISSIVLVEEDASYIKSDAILKIAQYLQLPFPVLGSLALPIPQFLRDSAYDAVAGSRYDIFGKTDTCRMRDEDQMDRFLE